jgi:AcrR family transcriptional regulator
MAPGTRGRLLDEACQVFAERGYDQASLRDITGRLGLDPALVHHYFGGKDGLYAAAVEAPATGQWPDDPLNAADELVRTFLRQCDEELTGRPLIALLRSASTHERSAAVLSRHLESAVESASNGMPGSSQARLRSALAVAQLVGLAVCRHVLRLEPMASLPRDHVVAAVAPVLARCLTEPGSRDAGAGTHPEEKKR